MRTLLKKEDDWLPYLKKDVLSTALSYPRYSEGKEELTCFDRKSNFALPSSANNFFDSFRDDNDEPIYTYNDECMRYFVRLSIKEERCGCFNQ